MKKGQNTRGYERYMALDIHREYLLVGAWNEEKEWVLHAAASGYREVPGVGEEEHSCRGHRGVGNDHERVGPSTTLWRRWRAGSWWPMQPKWVRSPNARVKTDKEDIKRLLKLLIGGIVPEVWVPPMHVRELRAFISYRRRLVKTGTMIRNRLQSLLHRHNLMLSEAGLLDQAWWEAAEKYQCTGEAADPPGTDHCCRKSKS